MAAFLSPLEVRLLPECPGNEKWMLLAPLAYESDLLGRIEVPVNFVTDFVTFRALNYTAHRPAVIHDFLYSCSDVERSVADAVFKEALTVISEDPLLVEEMYLAVRCFGGGHTDGKYTLRGGGNGN